MDSARVSDIMRHGVVAIEAGDPPVVAADLMVETRLGSLPVVRREPKGPVLAGIISPGDLLRGLRFELAETEGSSRLISSAPEGRRAIGRHATVRWTEPRTRRR